MKPTDSESVSGGKVSDSTNLKIEEDPQHQAKLCQANCDIEDNIPRKRRKKDELKESFKCPFCDQKLVRQQTLNDHIKRFHTKPADIEKGKGNALPQVNDNNGIIKGTLLMSPQFSNIKCTTQSENRMGITPTNICHNVQLDQSAACMPVLHEPLSQQQILQPYFFPLQPTLLYDNNTSSVDTSLSCPSTNTMPTFMEENQAEVSAPQFQTDYQDLLGFLGPSNDQYLSTIRRPPPTVLQLVQPKQVHEMQLQNQQHQQEQLGGQLPE